MIFFFIRFHLKGKPHSPGKPIATDITATQMRVSWTPPDFDGGTRIVGYLVEYKDVSSLKWSEVNLKEPKNTCIVRGLVNRTKYQFRVSAENQVGSSIPSISTNVCETLGNSPVQNTRRCVFDLLMAGQFIVRQFWEYPMGNVRQVWEIFGSDLCQSNAKLCDFLYFTTISWLLYDFMIIGQTVVLDSFASCLRSIRPI